MYVFTFTFINNFNDKGIWECTEKSRRSVNQFFTNHSYTILGLWLYPSYDFCLCRGRENLKCQILFPVSNCSLTLITLLRTFFCFIFHDFLECYILDWFRKSSHFQRDSFSVNSIPVFIISSVYSPLSLLTVHLLKRGVLQRKVSLVILFPESCVIFYITSFTAVVQMVTLNNRKE